MYNFQVQADKQSSNTSVRKIASSTVAGPVFVALNPDPDDDEKYADPEEVRQALSDSIV